MRKLVEIIADLKDGKKVDYEEARLSCLVCNQLLFFAEGDVKHLLSGNKLLEVVAREDYAGNTGRMSKRHIAALQKSPEEFLGNYHPDIMNGKRKE